jgi:hypothetical protein
MVAWIGLAVAIVAALAAGCAALFAWRSVREAKRANAFPASLTLLGEYRDDLEPDRRYIVRQLRNDVPDANIRAAELPDEARRHVLQVCEYLDHLGLVVDQGLADDKTVAAFMKESLLRMWDNLAGHIRAERAARDEPYSEYLEDLVARVSAIDAATVRRHLRKMREPVV